MIDEALKVWLIEVNTNPCLEESSQMLSQYIPRMLDDAFKITIDPIFGRNLNLPESSLISYTENQPSQQQQHFPVDGYSNSENLWKAIYTTR